MSLHDIILILAGAFAVLVGGGVYKRLVLGRNPKQVQTPPKPPPPPEHTATEYENAEATNEADAVVEAADDHGVHPGVVAADLDWLDSDDV